MNRLSEPWRQGELDLLCGVYAVVNSIKIAAPFISPAKSHFDEVFYAVARALEECPSSHTFLSYGLNRRSLGVALNAAGEWLESSFGCQLDTSWPYYRWPDVKSAHVFSRIQDHLAIPNTAAIVCVAGQIDHWTVVSDVTARRVWLFDSIGMKFIRRSSIGSLHEQSTRYQIMPTMTALIKVTDIQ